MSPRRWTIGLTGLLLLSGCMIGPNYRRPQIALPANFTAAGTQWHQVGPFDRQDRGAWWTIFHDPELDRLEQLAMQHNTSVAVAVAQRDQAEAQLDAVRASLWPTLTLSAQQQRNHSYFFAQANHSVGLQAGWEPDFWGLARRAIEQQGAALAEVEAQMASVRLSVAAQVAQTYFNLMQLRFKQDLDQQSLQDDDQLLRLIRGQEQAGIVNQASILQAQSIRDDAASQWQQDRWQEEQLVHALAVLCGELASNFQVHAQTWPMLPPVPAAIPGDLILQRPDVASAERSVAAANAGIGLAEIAYFPSLTLSASVSWEANKWGPWISAPDRFWSIGPSLAETLFDGGKRAAQVAQARANYRQMVASYRGVVLASVQEVEDDLSALQGLAQQQQSSDSALQSAQANAQVSKNQLAAGIATQLDVLNAQLSVLNQSQIELNIRTQRYQNIVLLVQALGGLWSKS